MKSEIARGKSLHGALRLYLTQNCLVPNEQLLGMYSSMVLEAAVATDPIALPAWLTAPGIAVATPLAMLLTSV